MARTNELAVRGVIETDPTMNMDPFIATATALTDYVVSQDSSSILTTALLLEIETYLAAHFYGLKDQQYRVKSTAGASASFQGVSGKGLEATDWGQQAMRLDVTGTLSAVDKGAGVVSIHWLGSTESEARGYWERN